MGSTRITPSLLLCYFFIFLWFHVESERQDCLAFVRGKKRVFELSKVRFEPILLSSLYTSIFTLSTKAVGKQDGGRCYCELETEEKAGGGVGTKPYFLQPFPSWFWKDSERRITSLIKSNSISSFTISYTFLWAYVYFTGLEIAEVISAAMTIV